jgi:hypothetical protein
MKLPNEKLYDASTRATDAGCKCEVFLSHSVWWKCYGYGQPMFVSACADLNTWEAAVLRAIAAAYDKSRITKPKVIQAKARDEVIWLKVFKVRNERGRDRLLVYFSDDPGTKNKKPARRVVRSVTTPPTVSNSFHDVTPFANKAGLLCSISFSDHVWSWVYKHEGNFSSLVCAERVAAIFSAIDVAFKKSGLLKPELICATALGQFVWIQVVNAASGDANGRLFICFPSEASSRVSGLQP